MPGVPGAPGAKPRRHWLSLPSASPAGGRGGGRLPALPLWCPAGGVPALPSAYPAFGLLSCPHPPPPFPGGEGGDLRLFYARGFAPCIPRAEPGRHWLSLPSAFPAGGQGGGRLPALPLWYPAGGLPALPPAYPAFGLLSCPHPPRPLPSGKGETFTLFRRGLPPPAPRALNRLRHLQNLPSRCPAADSGRHRLKETDSCRFCGEPWVQPRGCKGRSPLHKKTKKSPPSHREGGQGGWGQESKPKAG